MKKYRVMVCTYSWVSVRHPRLSSCYVLEKPKTVSIRAAYKFGRHSADFARYVMFPIEKSIHYKNELIYEINENIGEAGWKFWYPFQPWLGLRFCLEVVVDSEDML